MAGISQFVTVGYLIADANHVNQAVDANWALLESRGVTAGQRKRFEASIAKATRIAAGQSSGPTPLEVSRQALKDLLGSYRSSSRSIVTTMDGVDLKAEKSLQMKGGFPATDLLLSNYMESLGGSMKPYAAKLVAHGFSREEQTALIAAGVAFKKAFTARGLERGEARASTLSREMVFKKLQTETTYFRTAGHEALRTSIARKDFDRVAVPEKPATPAQVAARKVAAQAKKQATQAQKEADKAAKIAARAKKETPAKSGANSAPANKEVVTA